MPEGVLLMKLLLRAPWRHWVPFTFFTVFALGFGFPKLAAQQDEERIRKEIDSYYDSWLGVKAPDIGKNHGVCAGTVGTGYGPHQPETLARAAD
jgi:hypothetical protein